MVVQLFTDQYRYYIGTKSTLNHASYRPCFSIFFILFSLFFSKLLHMCNFCCIFAAVLLSVLCILCHIYPIAD